MKLHRVKEFRSRPTFRIQYYSGDLYDVKYASGEISITGVPATIRKLTPEREEQLAVVASLYYRLWKNDNLPDDVSKWTY